MRQSAAQIAGAIAASTPVNGIRIVGVDGPGGSVTSWLAAQLSAALSAPIIEIDDFVSWGRWMDEEDAYFAADGTRDRADLRIDTSDAG